LAQIDSRHDIVCLLLWLYFNSSKSNYCICLILKKRLKKLNPSPLKKKIPGGWLSFRFGGKVVLGLSMGIGSAITMLIPLCASIHYWALIVCLFFTGAAHGSFWPSVSSFWAYWAPDSEKSRLVGMASSGAKVGNIIALSLGSVLCLYGFAGGWPSIFYIFGSIGIVWSVLWFLLSTNSPKDHRFIGAKEKAFILDETKKAINARQYCQSVMILWDF
jgi:MFS family permease